MTSPRKKQIVVIGAGIVGATLAWRLSRRDVAVTVVEAGTPGGGASSHSFAWINATAKKPVEYHYLNRRSLEMWGRFGAELGEDVGLRWGGQLEWENTPEDAAELEGRIRQLQAWGYPARLINEANLRRLEPNLNPGPVTAAAFSEIDGAVDPQLVVNAALRRARENGARVLAETPVTGFELEREGAIRRIRSVRTAELSVAADVVVLAAGTDATRLAQLAGLAVPQEESPGVVVRTNPLPKLLQRVPIIYMPPVDREHPEVHIRQFADGCYMIGEGSQESWAKDDSLEHAEDLLARAARYLSGLGGARVSPVPVGYRPMPKDGYPVLGFAASCPNLYITLTHSGVTLAPVISELATLEIVDGAPVELLQDYRVERFAQGEAKRPPITKGR